MENESLPTLELDISNMEDFSVRYSDREVSEFDENEDAIVLVNKRDYLYKTVTRCHFVALFHYAERNEYYLQIRYNENMTPNNSLTKSECHVISPDMTSMSLFQSLESAETAYFNAVRAAYHNM